ncbi:hypothetical protein SRHO_G00036640 [Serrasalmus rhombeus]
MSKKKKEWKAEKERLLSLGLEERRKEYGGNYVTLEKIATWRRHGKSTGAKILKAKSGRFSKDCILVSVL